LSPHGVKPKSRVKHVILIQQILYLEKPIDT